MKKNRWSRIIVTGLLLGLVFTLAARYYLNYVQEKQVEAAKAHLASIEPKLNADARFVDVEVIVYSGFVSLKVEGTVQTQEDLDALKKIVEPSPVTVFWSVTVEGKK